MTDETRTAAMRVLPTLTEAQALGLTGAGEARSELVPGKGWRAAPLEDMVAVMWTVANRRALAPRFGSTIQDVCFEHAQYSCWLSGTPNNDWLLEEALLVAGAGEPSSVVQDCIVAAEGIVAATIADPTHEATHYYAPLSMIPPGRVPTWARGLTPCATIGQHLFFKGVA